MPRNPNEIEKIAPPHADAEPNAEQKWFVWIPKDPDADRPATELGPFTLQDFKDRRDAGGPLTTKMAVRREGSETWVLAGTVPELRSVVEEPVEPPEEPVTAAEEATERIAALIKKAAEELGRDPRDITWHDFREYMLIAWGSANRPRDAYLFEPRHLSRVGGFYRVRDAYFGGSGTPAESSIEKERLKAEASQARRVETESARQQAMLNEIARIADRFPVLPSAKPLRIVRSDRQPGDRVGNLCLSDLHIGSRLLLEEGTHAFGAHEEARRLARVTLNTVEYLEEHRLDELRVFIIGDIIHGVLHDPREGAPFAEQQCAAIWLLEQVLLKLASNVRKLWVGFTPGNHGRYKSRHLKRATVQKWDAAETVVGYAIKRALSATAHAQVSIPLRPWISVEGPGGKIFATHGDNLLNVGLPSKSIPTNQIDQQVLRINHAAPPDVGGPFDAFVVGHVHAGWAGRLTSGPWLVTNPPLVPPDGFANSLAIFDSPTGQWVWESREDSAVTDPRFIHVGPEDDANSSLEEIVRAWPGIDR